MSEKVKLHFAVRCEGLRDWERVHVVGSHPSLGSWNPAKSFPLQTSDSEIWSGQIEVDSSEKSITFRYIRIYWLEPAENEQPDPQLVLSKWETMLTPRHCLLDVESANGVAREDIIDQFGHYGGKSQISDGWILNDRENVVFFRIHGEALKFYKKQFVGQIHRVKIVPFDVRFREKDIEDDFESGNNSLPEFPSFSNTDLSVLTREDPIYGDQYVNGSVFRNDIDYLVFRTRTVSIQHLGFRIELYSEQKRTAIAYALPSTFPDTHGAAIFPFVGLNNMPVGQLNVDYMIANRCPAAKESLMIDSMESTYGRYWRRRQRILEIGHRGMGSSYTKTTLARENTIHSLNEAARRGADYVELDVQLTKDLKTVVYHDFHLLVQVTGRESPAISPVANGEHKALHEIAIKDLTLSQINLLHFEHISKATENAENRGFSVTPGRDDTNELHVPFPSLAQVLKNVDKDVGLNIEIKYPMYMKDGTHECSGYFEQNKFVDIILGEVAEYAQGRRIVFSCFEPDICTLIAQKQHKYPVLFLVVGATNRYTPFKDIRSDSSKIAANFAAGAELLGVNFHSEELLLDRNPITIADKYGLVKFVWGDDLNSKEVQQQFKKEMNIDGIIFDRIGEEDNQKQNIFIVENEHRSSLFVRSKGDNSRSPSATRRCFSLDQHNTLPLTNETSNMTQ